jgi:hypothetical protein
MLRMAGMPGLTQARSTTQPTMPGCPCCRVSAHLVDPVGSSSSGSSSRERRPQATTILIKFDPSVMQRQANLEAQAGRRA